MNKCVKNEDYVKGMMDERVSIQIKSASHLIELISVHVCKGAVYPHVKGCKEGAHDMT